MDLGSIIRERQDKDELPQIIKDNIGDVLEQLYYEFCSLGVKRRDIYSIFAKAMYGAECEVTRNEILSGNRLNYVITRLCEYVYDNNGDYRIYPEETRMEFLNDLVNDYCEDEGLTVSEKEWQCLREDLLYRFQRLLEIINYSNREVFSEKCNIDIPNLNKMIYMLEDETLRKILDHIESMYLTQSILYISKEQKYYLDMALWQMKKEEHKNNKKGQFRKISKE